MIFCSEYNKFFHQYLYDFFEQNQNFSSSSTSQRIMANPFAFKFLSFLLIPTMYEDKCSDIPTIHIKKCCQPPDIFSLISQEIASDDGAEQTDNICVRKIFQNDSYFKRCHFQDIFIRFYRGHGYFEDGRLNDEKLNLFLNKSIEQLPWRTVLFNTYHQCYDDIVGTGKRAVENSQSPCDDFVFDLHFCVMYRSHTVS